jgi:hypothetical protein
MASSGSSSYGTEAKRKQANFDAQVQSPGSWLLSAMALKAAADQINWRDVLAKGELPVIGISDVYRMLIGMAIESLLKGVMAAQGISVLDSKGNLAKAFSTHDLHRLAYNIDRTQFALTTDELRVLKEITPYIEWGGRYPIPRMAPKLIDKMHSSMDMEIELKLYERLYEHLAKIGWIIKGGNRLDLRPKKSM